MRTPITLQEFLFILNQNEDTRILLIDYKEADAINCFWKSDYIEYKDEHKDWFVQDFVLMSKGIEISIVKSKEELD